MPTGVWLALIVVAALAIRLLGAWHANLIFDERAHWALAETIDLRPGRLHLVSRTLDHPLLSIYILRLGSLLLGTSNFALRLPYVLAGTATVVPVYYLARGPFRRGPDCWLRPCWPSICSMRVGRGFSCPKRSCAVERRGDSAIPAGVGRTDGGAVCAVGFADGAGLSGEGAGDPAPAGLLDLLADHAGDRSALRDPRWYLAHGVFAAVIAPDLVWNASQWSESYLYRDLAMTGHAFRISLKPLSLYMGECFRAVVDRDCLGSDYVEGNIYVCHAVAGALYLFATAAMASLFNRPVVRCLVVVFLVVFLFFLVLPGGGLYEPFWWASISLIPAVVCTGGWMEKAAGRGRAIAGRMPQVSGRHTGHGLTLGVCCFGEILIVALGLGTARAMMNQGPYEPRASVQDFADDFLIRARQAFQRGDWQEAESRCIYALNIAGPRADAYYGLAQVAAEEGQPQRAERLLARCLAIDPQHSAALGLQRALREGSFGPAGRPLADCGWTATARDSTSNLKQKPESP